MPTQKELAESRAETIAVLTAQNAELRDQLTDAKNAVGDAEGKTRKARRALLEVVRTVETMRGFIMASTSPLDDDCTKWPFDDLACMYQVDEVLV